MAKHNFVYTILRTLLKKQELLLYFYIELDYFEILAIIY